MVKLLPEPTEEPTRQTCAPPHSIHPPTYRWEPDGAVDLLRMTAYLTLKLLD